MHISEYTASPFQHTKQHKRTCTHLLPARHLKCCCNKMHRSSQQKSSIHPKVQLHKAAMRNREHTHSSRLAHLHGIKVRLARAHVAAVLAHAIREKSDAVTTRCLARLQVWIMFVIWASCFRAFGHIKIVKVVCLYTPPASRIFSGICNNIFQSWISQCL